VTKIRVNAFAQDDLEDHETIYQAAQLKRVVDDVTDTEFHEDVSVVLALAMSFIENCEVIGADPFLALEQIVETFPHCDLGAEEHRGANDV